VQQKLRQQEHDVRLQVVENYLAILEAQKHVVTATEELQMVSEHRRVALALYEAGSTTRNDLLQADVRLSNARQQLLIRRNQADNLYLHLNFLLGLPATDRPALSEPAVHSVQQTTDSDASKALQQRPDLRTLRTNVTIGEQEVRESRTAFYPELFSRISLDYLENDKLREQTIYSASAGIKINLFDGFSSTSNRSKAVAIHARAKEQLHLAEEQARLEIATFRNDLHIAFERIAVTKESILQGKENLRINQNRYQERVGTATEVLDAQTMLTQTQTEHFRAIYDYQLAAARLRKATGQL
jgi:outer membrane protein TolC